MRGEESREERGEKRGGGEKRGEEVKYGYQYTDVSTQPYSLKG